MKTRALLALFVLALPALLPAQLPADRFAGTRAKIEALLRPRLKPEPLAEKPANPFQFTLPGALVALPTDPGPGQPAPDALSDDAQILAYGVARLRISGLVLRNGISHLLINSATYKESDLIPVRASGDTVYYIRIVRVTADDVTFGYNRVTVDVPLPR